MLWLREGFIVFSHKCPEEGWNWKKNWRHFKRQNVKVLGLRIVNIIQEIFKKSGILFIPVQFSSVALSCPTLLRPHGLQHARLCYSSPTPGACSNSSSLSWWCHPTISCSIVPFSSCLQSFSASGSFPMTQFFTSGGQSIGVSASPLVLPMNIQDWFPLGWTGWISLQSKGLLRVFSNTTVQKHQFFSDWLSL